MRRIDFWLTHPMIVIVLVILLLPNLAESEEASNCSAPRGTTDHVLFPVYEDSCQIGYENISFDAFTLVLGKLKDGSPETTQTLEGTVSRKLYAVPEERSPLEVFRNYEQGLKKRGYQTLFSCANDECGNTKQFMTAIFPEDSRKRMKAFQSDIPFYAFTGKPSQYYLAARSDDSSSYVSLLVGNHQGLNTRIGSRTIVLGEVVELTVMEDKLVDAEAMSKSIQETGKVALHNIFFDTGRSTIKPESRFALDEMAQLFKADSSLEVFVVGHTDNVGSYEANLQLSHARAQVVVQALVSQYGVPAKQLVPAGVASLGPIASNSTEQGRAQNRRVELVQR